jgi:hypothetical protein
LIIKFFRYPIDRNEIGEINFKNLFKIKALKKYPFWSPTLQLWRLNTTAPKLMLDTKKRPKLMLDTKKRPKLMLDTKKRPLVIVGRLKT